jgi:hypothetical protein
VAEAFLSARMGIQDPDAWWHISTGERILSSRAWPSADPFSFTVHGNPWLPYEWLGDVLMALAVRFGGLEALTAWVIVVASLLVALLYYYAWLRSGNTKAAFVSTALLAPLAGLFFNPRPQLLGYIFLLVTLILLERFRQRRQRSLWALPLVFVLWVNTHGSFVFGLAALAVYWASGLGSFRVGGLQADRWTPRERRYLLLVALLSVVALAVTPYGTRLAANPLDIAFTQPVNIANIREWQGMPFDLWQGKVFLGLVLLFVLAQVVLRLRYHLAEILLLFAAVFSTAVHRRFAMTFVIIFAPLLADLFSRWAPPYQPSKDRPALNSVLLLLVGSGLVRFGFPSRQEIQKATAASFPVGAEAYLNRHPAPGPMLNEYGWGGYLIWVSGGKQRVFIDGRTDIYEAAGVFPDYLAIMELDRRAPFLLRKYDVRSCLILHDAPLTTLLAASKDWREVYRDELSVIFVRH